MTQPTKSPWKATPEGMVYGGSMNMEFVCDTNAKDGSYTETEKANARLIELAPELLEALQWIAQGFAWGRDITREEMIGLAEAAIKKATEG